jgi:hypothetical protein
VRRLHTAAVVVALAASTVLLTAPPPADAHPFGPPPTARIWAEGDVVTIDWAAAPDDLALIGVELGLLPEDTPDAYLEAPTQVAPERAHEEQMSRSPELVDYLLERVRVIQRGRDCEGGVEPIERFLTRGATVVHRCAEPVTEVEVEIGLLHDVHPAYRTFAFSASDEAEPSQAVFTAASPRHTWRFGATADGTAEGRARGAGTVGLIILGLVAVLAVAGAELFGRRGAERGSDGPGA